MPFHIDRWKGSAHVQAMSSAARSGYLYLLSAAWQTDDCSLPDDEEELQVLSGMTVAEWAESGPRIKRRFTSVEGRLRNVVLHGEWAEAKRVFNARSQSAKRTNTERSPRRSPGGDRDAEPTHKQEQGQGQEQRGKASNPLCEAQAFAKAVQVELGLGGIFLLNALTDVMQGNIGKRGDGPAVTEQLVNAYRLYENAHRDGKLARHVKPEAFFGDGLCFDEAKWAWKKEHQPRARVAPVSDPHLAEIENWQRQGGGAR